MTVNFSLSPMERPFALFGGVYSNHVALESVIQDATERGVEQLVCLGDLGAFGPHPDRVFPLLRQRGVVTLKGNYDDSLARGLDDCQCGYTDPRDNFFARESYLYTFRNTSAANKSWLGKLPDVIRFEAGGVRCLVCHGSPRRINEFLWESTTPDQFLEKLFDAHDADVIFVTHTGIKWKRVLPSGRIFVNVGVIGRPENDGAQNVWYTVVTPKPAAAETPLAERLEIEFVALEYDYRRLADEMVAEGLPGEFVETILTGWWTTCLEILPAKERARGKH